MTSPLLVLSTKLWLVNCLSNRQWEENQTKFESGNKCELWAVIQRSAAGLLENTTSHHVNAVKWLDKLWWLCSLEVQVLESEVCFHNASSFDSGPQHILLGGHISTVGYPVQVIQVALWREKSKDYGWKMEVCRRRVILQCSVSHQFLHISVQWTHYAAESLSWYSRERLKQAWTPPSFQSRWMTPASSPVMKPSSAEPASTNSCRASSYRDKGSPIRVTLQNNFI